MLLLFFLLLLLLLLLSIIIITISLLFIHLALSIRTVSKIWRCFSFISPHSRLRLPLHTVNYKNTNYLLLPVTDDAMDDVDGRYDVTPKTTVAPVTTAAPWVLGNWSASFSQEGKIILSLFYS